MKISKYHKTKFILIVLFAGVYALNSCSKGTKGINSGKKLYTDFFVGDAGTQYYISPLAFENINNSKEKLLMDLTFRYKEKIKDSVAINFSIIGVTPLKKIKQVIITSQVFMVKTVTVNFLYNERSKKGFVSRFSFKIPLVGLKKMVDASYNWKLELQTPELKTFYYSSTKATAKSTEKLDQSLFIVID